MDRDPPRDVRILYLISNFGRAYNREIYYKLENVINKEEFMTQKGEEIDSEDIARVLGKVWQLLNARFGDYQGWVK